MSKTGITRVIVRHGEPLPKGTTDWARVEALTDEEATVAAVADPDAQPLAPSSLQRCGGCRGSRCCASASG